jgi:glutamate 5-kinase
MLRFVLKFGTSTLTNGTSKLSLARIADLVRQIARLQDDQNEVVLVSSGAIAAGREVLGFAALPKHIPQKQMLAAIGQPRLMSIYEQLFRIYEKTVAQVLLTRSDLSDRRRYLNARNTLDALLRRSVIPVINENDTVATEEIRFGDNDTLSAQVANLIEADKLILLTDQEGLFTSDPRLTNDALLIKEVGSEGFSEEMWKAAGGSKTGLGTGGMVTKLRAAELARQSGVTTYITKGDTESVVLRIANGENCGTIVYPLLNKLENRKRFLLAGQFSDQTLTVDLGAGKALRKGGSLLPAGITAISGSFDRGDSIRIMDVNGKPIAVGLANYSHEDILKIRGLKSSEIEPVLGYTFGDEVIHHNNLVLL